ncbi:MAG: YacL family protein [Amphritea sp.]|nr:YacL family protein [Amphritea sp.]
MDYDFTRDIYGNVCAEFSMGHEAIGSWLSEEVGEKQALISEILGAVEQLKNRQRLDYNREGHEFDIEISMDEVIVRAHTLDTDSEMDMPDEDLDFYDQESFARCGLDDFAELMIGWQQFVTSQR